MTNTIHLNPIDNVLVAIEDLSVGSPFYQQSLTRQPIPSGHKVAIDAIKKGEPILKYGQVIGQATNHILPGEHVHVHNVEFVSSRSTPDAIRDNRRPAKCHATFQGFVRPDGKVGTRNYVGIMATVNCAATVVSKIANTLTYSADDIGSSVEGVIPIVHQSGCGIPASTQSELTSLQRLLGGYLNHPNFFGWVIIGLGCEVNQINQLVNASGLDKSQRIKTVEIQQAGGTQLAIKQGLVYARQLLTEANNCKRTAQSARHLVLGLQCGGSDAWSGVSANPGLGIASDKLVAHGGSAILAETPEIYGAESLLYQRAKCASVKKKLQDKVSWWREYLANADTDLNNNPSPGNLKGGITTILEKSLGAVAKGGQAILSQVLEYAEPVSTNGLVFMDSPGFDPCSVTGEIASGANIVCFTTGRGSTFGAAGAPCLKLASNSKVFTHMENDMDINCGKVIDGDLSLEDLGDEIFESILAVASGRPTKSEVLGLGHYEFVPWHKGVVV